jgi:hypothetical protein
MILYHTGGSVIDRPDLDHGRLNADFGKGFYLTPDREFAQRWALSGGYLNRYDLDTEGLDILRLTRNGDWFRYLCDNRNRKDGSSADLVMGPIANDTLYNTFGFISSGFLTEEEALRLLLLGPEYTQVAIKTELALSKLRFLDATPIENSASLRALVKQEEESYLELFAKAMEELTD